MDQKSSNEINEYVVVRITSEEYDDLLSWLEDIGYKCGDDGWIPTKQSIETSFLDKYWAVVDSITKEKDSNKRKKLLVFQKVLIVFLIWMESCDEISTKTDKCINDLLKKFLVIEEEEEQPGAKGQNVRENQ